MRKCKIIIPCFECFDESIFKLLENDLTDIYSITFILKNHVYEDSIEKIQNKFQDIDIPYDLCEIENKSQFGKKLLECLEGSSALFFYIIPEGLVLEKTYWIKEGVEFLENNPRYVSYATNIRRSDGSKIVDVSKKNEWGMKQKEYISYNIESYLDGSACIAQNVIYRNIWGKSCIINCNRKNILGKVSYDRHMLFGALFLLTISDGESYFYDEITAEESFRDAYEESLKETRFLIECADLFSPVIRDTMMIRCKKSFMSFCRRMVGDDTEETRKLFFDIYKKRDSSQMFDNMLRREINQTYNDKMNYWCDEIIRKSSTKSEDFFRLIDDIRKKLDGIDIEDVRHYSFGEKNDDKTFCILYNSKNTWGLYTTYLVIMELLLNIKKQEIIPAIDLKNHYMLEMQDEKRMFCENAWDYYYSQPDNEYSLEEIYESKSVYCIDIKRIKVDFMNHWDDVIKSKKMLREWNSKLMNQVSLNEKILRRVDTFCMEHHFDSERILGVCVRVAFKALYENNASVIKNHPRQPDLHELLKDIEVRMVEWKCNKIFLAIEDWEYIEMIEKYFSGQYECIYYNRARQYYYKNGKVVTSWDEVIKDFKKMSVVDKNIEYITETYILSRCTALYAGLGSSAMIATLENAGEYENNYCYNCGNY